MKVLELFSGIGGMHLACKKAEKLSNTKFVVDVVGAVDINTSANAVYQHNFPGTRLWGRNIQALGLKELIALDPEVVLMSPPCQPFTTVGLRKDMADARCDALAYLIDTLPRIPSLKYLLLENVKGFDESRSRDLFTKMLTRAGFKFQELLLSPTQFGVPNSRTRYYLIAKKCDSIESGFCFETSNHLITSPPKLKGGVDLDPELSMSVQSILECTNSTDPLYQKYRIPDADLVKRFNVLDIVCSGETETCTNCFTKAYTHYAKGTGSVLSNLSSMAEVNQILEKVKPLSRIQNSLDSHTQNLDDTCDVGSSKRRKIEDAIEEEEKVTRTLINQKSKLETRESLVQTANDSITNEETPIGKNGKDESIKMKGTSETSIETLSNLPQNEDMLMKNKSCPRREALQKGTNTKSKSEIAHLEDVNQTLRLNDLCRLNLRYFSPTEIAKLMCFPDNFSFPRESSDKSKYKLLGNSINVHVVAYCICLMLLEANSSE